jgi:hypothetical protein
MKETELAKIVIEWLKKQKWEIYQEVQFSKYSTGNIADIVAVKNNELWIVETKTSLSLEVMEQAWRWEAHYRSVAVPRIRNRRDRTFAYMLAKRYLNIGILEVIRDKDKYYDLDRVYAVVDAPLMQKFDEQAKRKIKMLTELHKTYAKAGSTSGNHLTPYKQTMIKVRKFIEENPGCTLKDIIKDIGKGHYSSTNSAKNNIRKALAFWEDWCQVDTNEREYKYFVE